MPPCALVVLCQSQADAAAAQQATKAVLTTARGDQARLEEELNKSEMKAQRLQQKLGLQKQKLDSEELSFFSTQKKQEERMRAEIERMRAEEERRMIKPRLEAENQELKDDLEEIVGDYYSPIKLKKILDKIDVLSEKKEIYK